MKLCVEKQSIHGVLLMSVAWIQHRSWLQMSSQRSSVQVLPLSVFCVCVGFDFKRKSRKNKGIIILKTEQTTSSGFTFPTITEASKSLEVLLKLGFEMTTFLLIHCFVEVNWRLSEEKQVPPHPYWQLLSLSAAFWLALCFLWNICDASISTPDHFYLHLAATWNRHRDADALNEQRDRGRKRLRDTKRDTERTPGWWRPQMNKHRQDGGFEIKFSLLTGGQIICLSAPPLSMLHINPEKS